MSGDYTTITDPSAYFHTQLYTGSGSSGLQVRNNANAGDFTPDWLWIKPRSIADNHVLFDSSRGFNKQLKSNGNDAEDTHSPARITRETNGFDVDTTDQNYNQSSATYVAWQWIANGGSTSTNSDGTVNVTIQVNSTAGFSIMKWNGNGTTTGTVGHGLGAVPDMILNKYGLDGTSNWGVAFPKFETSKLLTLNGTGGFTSASGMSGYNSSTFVDGNGAATGGTIAYCFKQVKGYSRFGFYVGNGNTDGPSIYTGFKPAFLMIKRSNGSGYWVMLDSKRNLPNGTGQRLGANANDAEYGSTNIDFLSNGFKVRASNSDSDTNLDGGTYVYMAFADKPYVTPDGVISTAV